MSSPEKPKAPLPLEPDTKARENILENIEGGPALGDLDVCYQCGTCSGGCPVARMVPEYNVRKIIKRARENRIDVTERILWFCSTCYLCYERCPQDVKPIHIIHNITNLVSSKRCAPTSVIEGNRRILATGRIVEVSRLTQQRRKRLALPELKVDVSEDFKKIAELTGLEDMVE